MTTSRKWVVHLDPAIARFELERVGTARHGHRWKAKLARELGVHPNTVHNWLKVGAVIPRHRMMDLGELPPVGGTYE